LFAEGDAEAEASDDEDDIKVLTKNDLTRARSIPSRETNIRRSSDASARRTSDLPAREPKQIEEPKRQITIQSLPQPVPSSLVISPLIPPSSSRPVQNLSDPGEGPPVPVVSVPTDDFFLMPAPAPPVIDDELIPSPVKRSGSKIISRSSSGLPVSIPVSPVPVSDIALPPELPLRPDIPSPPSSLPPQQAGNFVGPPPPPPPMPVDFSKQISSGPPPPQPSSLERPLPDSGANAVSDLLNDIRKGIPLKKVDATSTEGKDKKLGLFSGNTVEEILKRRAAIAGSDSSDSDDDYDDDEWDDDEYSL